MEGPGDQETGLIPFQEYPNPDFGIVDFIAHEPNNNLDHFIHLIHAENSAHFTSQPFYLDHHININTPHDHHHVGCFTNDDPLFSTEPPLHHDQLFDFDEVGIGQVIGNSIISPGCSAVNEYFPNDAEEIDDGDEEEESSETTTNTSAGKKQSKGGKTDRARTLISERRRRGRMKEKLYALRALVPYITKMDKASIVGDAVLYVQDLQMQAKKLKSEIAGLEYSSLTGSGGNNKYQGRDIHNPKNMNATTTLYPIIKKIIKIDVFQVEERGCYVRIVTKKGKGVAVCLYRALESISSFNVQSSNLAAHSENYVFTFTLHSTEVEAQMKLPSLKMWIASVFLNQGFDFETSSSSSA